MSFAISSIALQGAGVASSTIGSYFSAKTQKSNLYAQAAIADTNSRIAELGAQSALFQGEQEVGKLTMSAGRLKSSQRAAMAANGIDLGEGNAAEVQATTEIMKETDANTLTANAVRNAWGYRTQSTNYQNEALTKRASAGSISPGSAAFGTLLGGAGSVASSWYTMNKAGGFTPGDSRSDANWGGWVDNNNSGFRF